MSGSAADIRRRELAQIHIARKELGMDEETYRLMLHDTAGVTSSADLTPWDRSKVLARMRKLGWQPKTARRPRRRITAQTPQDRMIRGLWLELADLGAVRDRSEGALGRYVARQTGIDAQNWISGEQAEQVIESLKAWRNRVKRQQQGGSNDSR
ncbi:gp16 family protein [Alloalcanivorax xenomutans]